jgi:hypothetical protein
MRIVSRFCIEFDLFTPHPKARLSVGYLNQFDILPLFKTSQVRLVGGGVGRQGYATDDYFCSHSDTPHNSHEEREGAESAVDHAADGASYPSTA